MFSHFWSSDQVHEGGRGGVGVIICQSLQGQSHHSETPRFPLAFQLHLKYVNSSLVLIHRNKKPMSSYLDVLRQRHLVLFGHGLGDLHSFSLFVLRQKPSWRFWDKPAHMEGPQKQTRV